MSRLYNDAVDDEPIFERMESFGGGMDAYSRATLLPLDAFQYSENGVIPDNFGFRTRPGADSLGGVPTVGGALLLEAGQGSGYLLQEGGGKLLIDPVRRSDTTQQPIQGLKYFDTPAVEQLIRAKGGAFSFWDGSQWNDVTGFTLSDELVNFEAAQGVDKLFIVDGTDCAIWDGSAFTTTGNGDNDPPKGASVVLWHAGRMWAAGFGGLAANKENDAIWGSAVAAFGDGDWNNVDRQIRIGVGDGDPIIGLKSLSNSADKGFVMAIGKQNSLWLINTDPRVEFTSFSTQIGPERVEDGVGLVGRRAWCVFGNDLLIVSPDKNIYSLARMQGAAGQYQISPPLSVPIQPFIDRINWDYAYKIAAVKYRELALFSVPLDASTKNNTVLVYNGRLQKWVGVWTGWTPNCWEVTRYAGVHRLVFGDSIGQVPQWKDWKDLKDDATYLDDTQGYPTRLWTRAMLFGEALNDKDAYHCEERYASSNAMITTTAVADNADWKSWSLNLKLEGPSLPIPQLPFDLIDTSNQKRRKGLRGSKPFNEIYLKIESDAGWFELRNVSLSAFLNTLATQ